jgi:hypothetical protein
LTVVGCAAGLLAGPADLGAEGVSPQEVLDRFLAAAAHRAPASYRAFRRLEGSNAKFGATGWLDVVTEFDPQDGLRYRILAEEGSARIRGALKSVLDGERKATLQGQSSTTALTRENYEFEPGPVGADGLVELRVRPRRRDAALVDGSIFVMAEDAGLVRVEGRLAKSPSFWTRSVEVVRRYERRAGVLVPVEVRSLADVKLAGPSSFVMSYGYESVNGQAAHDVQPKFLMARLNVGGK